MAKQKYFSHDSNARNDEKIVNMRMQMGAGAYAIYFMILERLRETEDFMGIKDYNAIAFDLRVDAKDVKRVIEDFGLFQFTEDGKLFYSESFRNRMRIMEDKRMKQVEAGKRTAEKRWVEGRKAEAGDVTNLPQKGNSKKLNLRKSGNSPITNLSKGGNLPTESDGVVTNLSKRGNLPIIEGTEEGENVTNLSKLGNLPIAPQKRKEPKEKDKKENLIIVESPSKEEDSMSLTPKGVTDDAPPSSPSLFGEMPEAEKDVDYAELIKFWNTVTKGVFGYLRNIENKRRQMTRARIRENGYDQFLQAIRNAAASEFLHSATWFSYDWMICPNNFVKVLEDKYGKRERTESTGASGLGPAGLEAANSIPMGGNQGGNAKPVRKRVYD